jgi:hypothetical protein
MIEYVIISSKSKPLHELMAEYDQRSILEKTDKQHFIQMKDDVALLARSRFNYQGSPIYENGNSFTVLVGYIVSEKFQNDPQTITKQIHYLLKQSGDRSWIDMALGEFQIVHFDGVKVEFLLSKTMTHPLYYSEDSAGIGISNRSALACLLVANPSFDVMAQLEIIAFDSIISNRTAYEQVLCLDRGTQLTFDGKIRLIPKQNLWHLEAPTDFSGTKDLSDWFVRHLALLPKQMNIDRDMTFNLSGGKDSRVLLSLFKAAGLMDYHSEVITLGEQNDPEVLAAKNITQHYHLAHTIKPRQVPANSFLEKLPLHIFQMEGEINARVLHGNYKGLRKCVFTGHEAGLRESFVGTESINSLEDVNSFIDTSIPLDPIGFLHAEPKLLMRAGIKKIHEQSHRFGVLPKNFINWFSIVGRGCRWVGKLTSSSSPSGLYANLFCSSRIVEYAHNLGVENRKREMFHFAMLAHIDTEILTYPFANQDWNDDLKKQFGYIKFPPPLRAGPNPVLQWWDRMFQNKILFKQIIDKTRHPKLERFIDYNKMFSYIDKVQNPSARAMLSIFAVITSNVMFHGLTLDRDGVTRMERICCELKDSNTDLCSINSF